MTKDLLGGKVLMIIEMKFTVFTDYCDAPGVLSLSEKTLRILLCRHLSNMNIDE